MGQGYRTVETFAWNMDNLASSAEMIQFSGGLTAQAAGHAR